MLGDQGFNISDFEIPAFAVTLNGEDHTTEPLALTVSSAPAPEGPGGGTDPNSVAPEDLFLTVRASRSRLREGEPLVVEYRIFTRVDVNGFSFQTIPQPQGFWVEEIPVENPPQVEQTVRNGTQYTTAVIRRVALVPTGPGQRSLDPLGIEAQVFVFFVMAVAAAEAAVGLAIIIAIFRHYELVDVDRFNLLKW